MDIQSVAMLVAAGIAGGTISSLVGGAAVVTYPALIAAGLAPVVATATNLVALIPGNVIAVTYERAQLPSLDRRFLHLLVSSIGGTALGAVLLVITPERMFAAFVPALLGFATILFAYAGRISEWIRQGAVARGEEAAGRGRHSLVALFLVSIYGGYFGAGLGVLMLGVLTVGTGGDYRSANAVKNLLTSVSGLAATAIYMAEGKIAWPATLAMMAGALLGGFIGARLAQIVAREVMRAVVVAVGALLTVGFAWRYWF